MTTPTNGPDQTPGAGGTPEPPTAPLFPSAPESAPAAQPAAPQASEPTQPVPASQPTQPVPTAGNSGAPEVPQPTWAAAAPGQPAAPTQPAGAGQPPTTPPASPVIEGGGGEGGGRKRTAIIAGGAVAAVAVLGIGGAFAYNAVLGGGGAQPESALPASTVAFAKVDLDPSGSQKIDAIQFLRKFPDAREKVTGEDADLRKVVFDTIQDEGVLQDVDYASDIEPWLGERFGFGVIPAAEGDEPVVAVALAVKDKGKAEDSIAKLSDSAEVQCSVGDEYAVCAQAQEGLDLVLDGVKKGTLEDAEKFSSDMGDLGEDGIATMWGDLGAAKGLIQAAADASGAPVEVPDAELDKVSGRFAAALRFDGPNLEFAGKAFDLPKEAQVGDDTASVDTLPEGTLAAISVAGVGKQVGDNWAALEEQIGGPDQIEAIETETGLALPDDLVKALGSRLTVAFGGLSGDSGMPDVALVTDGDRGVLTKIVEDVIPALSGGADTGVVLAEDGDDTVLALGQAYADKVKSGSGLADSDAFTSAVPDADGAQVIAYADIQAMVKQFGSDLGEEEAANLAALKSAGLSVKVDGADASFGLRLTTK